MKTKSTYNIVLIAIVVLFIAYLWFQHEEKKQLQQTVDAQNQRINNLESSVGHTRRAFVAQTELIHELAQKVPNIDATVLATVSKLDEMALQCALVIPDVAQELKSAGNLLKAEEMVKSVATMANIVENLLKKWLYDDEEFKRRYETNIKKKSINFGNLIDFAFEKKLFNVEEIAFLREIKEIRNKASHELAVQKTRPYLLYCQEQSMSFLKSFLPRLNLVF